VGKAERQSESATRVAGAYTVRGSPLEAGAANSFSHREAYEDVLWGGGLPSPLDLIHPAWFPECFSQVLITGSSDVMPGHVTGRVPQQVLDPLSIPFLEPAFEDSPSVPEQLRIYMNAGSLASLMKNFGQAVRGERASIESQEELTMVGLGTPAKDIGSQGCSGGLVEAQELLPSHFPAGDLQVAVLDIHLVELEAGELASTKRGIKDHDNDGFIPGAGWRVSL